MKTIWAEQIEYKDECVIKTYPIDIMVDNILRIAPTKLLPRIIYKQYSDRRIYNCTDILMKGEAHILINEEIEEFKQRLKELE